MRSPVRTPLLLFLPLALLPLALLLGSCGADEHAAGHPEEPEDPRPDLAVTLYQGGLELFMEYPAFVVGEPSPLIAHFTDTSPEAGFAWVTSGRITATLLFADGTSEAFFADELLRNGIFKPVVKPTRAGSATLSLVLEGHPAAGEVRVDDVFVHPTVDAAVAGTPQEEAVEPTVGYLKESQWKTLYATEPAGLRPIRGGLQATGQLKAVAGQAGELVAPFAGRLVTPVRVPHLGMAVRRGELLGSVLPIGGDRAEAEFTLRRAEAELQVTLRQAERAESLHPEVISDRELESARAALEVGRAQVQATKRRLAAWSGDSEAGGGFELRAPVDGVISWADVVPGQVVNAGQRLLSVINADRLWLEARVFESQAVQVESATGAMFSVSGDSERFLLDDSTGARLVAVGAAIDPMTRTVPVLFEFANPGSLKPGMFAKVTVFVGDTRDVLAVPLSAVVDDNGFQTVYVMEGGESFFKRRVSLGAVDGGWAEVLAGVVVGERVVSRGAYEIKLSTASGAIPEHGHQH